MPHNVIAAMAGLIRQVDGDNRLSPTELGEAIVAKMPPSFQDNRGRDMADYISWINPDKQMGAGRLAELIVAEFDLDEADR